MRIQRVQKGICAINMNFDISWAGLISEEVLSNINPYITEIFK